MFDLNQEIARWRQALREKGIRRQADLDELESHLLEMTDRLMQSGVEPGAAWQQAMAELGEPDQLGAEYAKKTRGRSMLLRLVGGGSCEMDENVPPCYKIPTRLMLFFGLSSLACWFCALWFIVDGYLIRGTGFGWAMKTLFPISLIFLVVAAPLLGLGFVRLRKLGKQWTAATVPLIVTVLLLPVLWVVAELTLFLVPEVWVRLTHDAPKVMSALSSTKQDEAYVIARPTFDECDHHLFLRRAGETEGREVGKLGYEGIQSIQWSPDGQLVVFQSTLRLVVVRASDFKSRAILLTRMELKKDPGASPEDYRKMRGVTAIEFPRPGVMAWRYQIKGEVGSDTVDMNVL